MNRFVSAFVSIFLVAACGLVWLGGYWENLPLLDRVSGPRRFEQYACHPLPNAITEARGGYSGFPHGFVRTRFAYRGQPEDLACLREWTAVSLDLQPGSLGEGFVATHLFAYKPRGDLLGRWQRFMAFDDRRKQGVLFVP